MSRPHGGRRQRRTFPAHYKETLVRAYDLASQVSPSAADALLRAEDVPLTYINRWRQEMPHIGTAHSTCACHGSVHYPRAGTRRNKRNKSN
ncbi:hypothetical protein AB0C74_39360 [Spirillospora sp. NPDC048832]|jgi:hypothetical protein